MLGSVSRFVYLICENWFRFGSCSVKLLTSFGIVQRTSCAARGGASHFHLGGPLEGPVLQQGELSMVCVGLSERDLLRL